MRSCTLTEVKPVPIGVVTGPLSPTPLRTIESRTSCGRGLPYFSSAAAPARCDSHSNFAPAAAITRERAAAPPKAGAAPGIKVTHGERVVDASTGLTKLDLVRYYESIAHPFEWKFTRADLNALMARMRSRYAETHPLKLAA